MRRLEEKKSTEIMGYHYIPKDPHLRKQWVISIRREPPYPKDENFAVCGIHFTEDCFSRDLQSELTGKSKQKFKLKEGAIPTIFPFSKPKRKRISSETRQNKRQMKDVIDSLKETTANVDEIQQLPCSSKSSIHRQEFVEEIVGDEYEITSEHDTSYVPSEDEKDEENDEENDFNFMFVSWEQLKPLFNYCVHCGSTANITKRSTRGATIFVTTECTAGHEYVWHSLENKKTGNTGHIAISASILLSGSTFQSFYEAMNIAKVPMFKHNAFYRIQNKYIFPAINNIYQQNAREILERTKKQVCPLCLIGDGRCDSPGFCSTYGTYTLMNDSNNEIIDYFIAHVRNAGNSQNMEKYGLAYLLEFLKSQGLEIDTLTTDQHIQVRAFLKKDYPEISHQFDIWHRGKNLRKKLEKVAKKKAFRDLQPWIKSIVNHFWWCCANCDGNVYLLKDMWVHLLQHTQNIHDWSDANSSYTSCAHGPLTERDCVAKKWLTSGSMAYAALEKIVLDGNMIKDLPNLVNFKHSGSIEVYHNLLLKYCPKRLSFSYKGMHARTQLAILDHNSGLNRKQVVTKDNELRFKTQYSKSTGQWVAKKVLEPKSRHYITEIMNEIQTVTKTPPEKNERLEVIPKNIAPSPNPGKKNILSKQFTRFIAENRKDEGSNW